ncbi:MAG: CopG family transcriptional regulator [Candidatus Gracilibacteria bacterium]|nr:CopG family transcriptional regulator [Candidatus Gracilibacteria bacterium]
MFSRQITDNGQAKNATVKLSASERDRIKSIATWRNRTPHFIMKEAIQTYLKSAEIEQNFITAGEESWNDFEKTGLHITLDEARGWANELKIHPKATIPACHK